MKIALLIAALLIGGSTISMRRFLRAKLADHPEDSVYTPFALASLATIIPFCGILIALFIVFQALSVAPDLDQIALDFAKRVLLLTALAIFLTTAARNLAIAGNIRKAMKWLLILSGLLYGADSVLMEYGRISGSPIEMIVAHSYVFSSIFACFLLVFSSMTLRSKSERARFFCRKNLLPVSPCRRIYSGGQCFRLCFTDALSQHANRSGRFLPDLCPDAARQSAPVTVSAGCLCASRAGRHTG